jgi:hypothetical protein
MNELGDGIFQGYHLVGKGSLFLAEEGARLVSVRVHEKRPFTLSDDFIHKKTSFVDVASGWI